MKSWQGWDHKQRCANQIFQMRIQREHRVRFFLDSQSKIEKVLRSVKNLRADAQNKNKLRTNMYFRGLKNAKRWRMFALQFWDFLFFMSAGQESLIHWSLHHSRIKQIAVKRRNARTITSQTVAFYYRLTIFSEPSFSAPPRLEPARKCVGGGHSVTLWLSIDQGHNFHDHYTTEGDRKHLQKWSGAYVGAAHP